MHVDITLDHLTKVEGNASLDIKIKDNKVEYAHYKILDSKRFYTRAIEGKSIMALPQLLSRICGTCSNAHLLCSIEACEKALGIIPSPQSMLMKHLTMYGLNIRDHALHLYLFVMPDLYGVDSFLDLDENDEEQHRILHDCFQIKACGNYLASIVAGRSVHAIYPTVGGFVHFPEKREIEEAIQKLHGIRPAVLRLVDIFDKCDFAFDRQTNYMALVTPGIFSYLEGSIMDNKGKVIAEKEFADHLEHTVLPYSQASAYKHEGESYMVGALARVNLQKNTLHIKTRESIKQILEKFPSTNIYHNNLAQAVEILHSIDHALEILENNQFVKEEVIKKTPRADEGVGVIEAPRGLLFHRVAIDDKGIVQKGQIVVPTGQNQINIEEDMYSLVNQLLAENKSKDEIVFELEKLIRAYDPCMSCAVHFLKVRWL